MMDGYYTTPEGGRGKTNQKGLAGDRFQVTVTFFTHGKQDLAILVGSERGPWGYEWPGLFTTLEGKRFRKNQRDFTGDIFLVTVPLFNVVMSFHQSILKRNNVGKEMLDMGVFFLTLP